MGWWASLKLHFLYEHLDFFQENLDTVSEKQGEGCHQDIKELGKKDIKVEGMLVSCVTVVDATPWRSRSEASVAKEKDTTKLLTKVII